MLRSRLLSFRSQHLLGGAVVRRFGQGTMANGSSMRHFTSKPGRLAIIRPDLAKQWHASKNEGKKPSQFLVTATDDVWWSCPDCAHEWEQSIAVRVNAASSGLGSTSTCPECARRASLSLPFAQGDGSASSSVQQRRDQEAAATAATPAAALVSTHAALVQEQWDAASNGALSAADVTANSLRTVWWRSTAVPGFSFRRRVRDHVADTRCPTEILKQRLDSRRERVLRLLGVLAPRSDAAATYLAELGSEEEKNSSSSSKAADASAAAMKESFRNPQRVVITPMELRHLLHVWNAQMTEKSDKIANLNGHIPQSSSEAAATSGAGDGWSFGGRKWQGRKISASERAKLPVLHLGNQHYALEGTHAADNQTPQQQRQAEHSSKRQLQQAEQHEQTRQGAAAFANHVILHYQTQLHRLDAIVDEVTAPLRLQQQFGGEGSQDSVLAEFSVLNDAAGK